MAKPSLQGIVQLHGRPRNKGSYHKGYERIHT